MFQQIAHVRYLATSILFKVDFSFWWMCLIVEGTGQLCSTNRMVLFDSSRDVVAGFKSDYHYNKNETKEKQHHYPLRGCIIFGHWLGVSFFRSGWCALYLQEASVFTSCWLKSPYMLPVCFTCPYFPSFVPWLVLTVPGFLPVTELYWLFFFLCSLFSTRLMTLFCKLKITSHLHLPKCHKQCLNACIVIWLEFIHIKKKQQQNK